MRQEIPEELIPELAKKLFARQQQDIAKSVRFNMPKPYSPWQKDLMTSRCRLVMTFNGTKTGKTLGGSARIANFSFQAYQSDGAIFRIIAPGYRQSGYTYQYLCRLFPASLPYQKGFTQAQQIEAAEIYNAWKPKRTEGKLTMRWPHNQALIQCLHAKDPETTLEGERTYGNLLDEASKMPEQVFASTLSTTTATGGWIAITTTPRGNQHWTARLYREIREHMAYCEAKGKPYEQLAYSVPTWTSPYVSASVIEHARKTLPDRIFRQLYGAELVDDGSVFIGVRSCVQGAEIPAHLTGWQVDDCKQKTVVIGADWAKRSDYTVFIAIEVSEKPRIVGFRRLHEIPYSQSVKELHSFAKKFGEVMLIRHDRTGVGDVIDEMLSYSQFNIDPVVFNHQNKCHMVDHWSVALSSQAIGLPDWFPLLSEHDSYDVRTNVLGKPIYGAMQGAHDDIVTACFLAWSAYLETRGDDFDISTLEDIKDNLDLETQEDTIDSWYSSLIEDSEED